MKEKAIQFYSSSNLTPLHVELLAYELKHVISESGQEMVENGKIEQDKAREVLLQTVIHSHVPYYSDSVRLLEEGWGNVYDILEEMGIEGITAEIYGELSLYILLYHVPHLAEEMNGLTLEEGEQFLKELWDVASR